MSAAIINIYTGLYSDNINKEIPGTAFGAIMSAGGESKHTSTYDPNATYMVLWMDNMASLLEKIADQCTLHESITLFTHVWNNNVHIMCKKLLSIFNELKDHEPTLWKVLDLKLRRKNKSYYEYHVSMKRIVIALLTINRRIKTFTVYFNATHPFNCGDMRLAQNLAELALTTG